MDKFKGTLQLDGGEIPEATRSGQSKLDQMLEAQMIADIVRANTNLRQFNAFRVANDKYYKDKALEEARRKEIREPLEAALTEIDLLNGKLSRRNEIISSLRTQLYAEVIHNTQRSNSAAVDESRGNHLQELQLGEEIKCEDLEDKLEAFKPLLVNQQQQITKLKRIVASQADKIKHLFDEIDKLEIAHKDEIARLNGDKGTSHPNHHLHGFLLPYKSL